MKRKQLARIDLSGEKPRLKFINGTRAFLDDLKDFHDEDRVWVEVSTYRRSRSLSQNALFHVYLSEIANETGQDLETVKSTVKLLYARKPLLDLNGNEMFNEQTGERLEFVQDTSKMTTVEMAELTENTRMFALEFFGITLESANEQTQLKFKQ